MSKKDKRITIHFTINNLLRKAMVEHGAKTDAQIASKLESLLQADVDEIVTDYEDRRRKTETEKP